MNIFTHFFSRAKQDPKAIEASIRQDLMRREALVGKTVFGPIPKGRDREFFRIDNHTWIWQENWKDEGKSFSITTKYVVRNRDVVKSVNGGNYEKVPIAEASRLDRAIQTYVKRVGRQVYGVAV